MFVGGLRLADFEARKGGGRGYEAEGEEDEEAGLEGNHRVLVGVGGG